MDRVDNPVVAAVVVVEHWNNRHYLMELFDTLWQYFVFRSEYKRCSNHQLHNMDCQFLK